MGGDGKKKEKKNLLTLTPRGEKEKKLNWATRWLCVRHAEGTSAKIRCNLHW